MIGYLFRVMFVRLFLGTPCRTIRCGRVSATADGLCYACHGADTLEACLRSRMTADG